MLYIWMPEGDGAWRWRVEGDWQVAANLDGLLQATSSENQKEAIVFFPTSSTQILQQPMSRQQLRQIGAHGVRYLLEEYALTPVDQLSVHYHLDAAQQLNVMAVPKETISHYQHILALGGWRVQALVPDFLLLPVPSVLEDGQEVQVLMTDSSRVVRTAEYAGYAGDDLASLLSYFPDIKKMTVWGVGAATADDQHALISMNDTDVPVERHLPAHWSLSDSQLIRHVFNVMPKSRDGQVSGYWRAVAAVFICAIVVQMIYDGVRWWRYHHVAEQTLAQSMQQYKAWFPNDHRVNEQNLKRSVESALGADQNADMSALSLISRVGPMLQQAQLQASQIQYHDQVLELQVMASGLPVLEALRKQLADQGLKAQLGQVNPANGQVSGLLRVQL